MSIKKTEYSTDQIRLSIGSLLGDTYPADQVLPVVGATTILVATVDRVLPLVAHRLAALGHVARLPADSRQVVQQSTRAHAALELGLRPDLVRLVGAFDRSRIPLLLLKGAALAYTDYAAPFLRPRSDTDILIRPDDREQTHALLMGLGYVERLALSTPRVSQQAQYSRVLRAGIAHNIDLHWRTFNPAAFAGLLTFDEMWIARRPVPPLGPAAAAPGRPHALLLSLLHRSAHHEPTPDLLWLHDVHLGARGLTAGEWDAFVDIAERHGVSELCARGLEDARRFFSTKLPAAAPAWIAERLSREVPARFRVFQRPGRRVIDMFVSDFLASTWGGRVDLIREHVLPPRAYMNARFGAHAGAMLPLLYLHRATTGAWRWFRRDRFR
jgi:hypothetical protein